MRILFRNLMIVMTGLCVSSTARAETLMLETGQKIEGQIIERNNMRVVIDVRGRPHTLFLGEIATIDGNPVEMPPEQKQETTSSGQSAENSPVQSSTNTPQESKKANVPGYDAQQASLSKSMDQHHPNTTSEKQPVDQKAPPSSVPAHQVAAKAAAPQQPSKAVAPAAADKMAVSFPDMMDKMSDTGKSVVPTADGGVIVVTHDKITKFDKDLNVVKAMDLDAINAPAPK